MTIHGTICWILRDGAALLLNKEQGFGAGRVNAPGGKLAEGESPEECVVREVFEETGLRLRTVKRHGALRFYFGDVIEPDWIVHVFSSTSFEGTVKDSHEGSLTWVKLDRIPFEQMWADDQYWLHLLLAGKVFEGDFWFDTSGEKILRHRLTEQEP